jgi:hypothetical protein
MLLLCCSIGTCDIHGAGRAALFEAVPAEHGCHTNIQHTLRGSQDQLGCLEGVSGLASACTPVQDL